MEVCKTEIHSNLLAVIQGICPEAVDIRIGNILVLLCLRDKDESDSLLLAFDK